MINSVLQCTFVQHQTPEFPPSCFVYVSYRDSFSRLLPFRLLRELKHQGWYPCWPLLNDRKVSRWQDEVGRRRPPSSSHPGRLRAGDEQDQELEGILLSPRESHVWPSPNRSTCVSPFQGYFPHWWIERRDGLPNTVKSEKGGARQKSVSPHMSLLIASTSFLSSLSHASPPPRSDSLSLEMTLSAIVPCVG